nr:MAG TPA: hypothetical protein [Caudoviricetes sp.]DAK24677.1 MAG TPA: hypothetical protein [Caudoviricetes sp.]DAR36930.1 MAG TPA: hypothetical protein [Caudoviricetes sp.]DAX98712.1 MAG TPA: hypothetical protein [Caudoviricetes sp.]
MARWFTINKKATLVKPEGWLDRKDIEIYT